MTKTPLHRPATLCAAPLPLPSGWFLEAYAVQYAVDSVTPVFLAGEERVVRDSTDSPATATFTSSVSETSTGGWRVLPG